MRRREFVRLIGGAAAWPIAARAQQSGGLTGIGFLPFGSPSSISDLMLVEAFREGLRDAGLILNRISPPGALIVAADNGDPTLLYYARRKGWHFLEAAGIYNGEPRDSAQAIADLEELRKRGASYLVVTSSTSWWLDYYAELGQYVADNSAEVEATTEFKIYKLNPESP